LYEAPKEPILWDEWSSGCEHHGEVISATAATAGRAKGPLKRLWIDCRRVRDIEEKRREKINRDKVGRKIDKVTVAEACLRR